MSNEIRFWAYATEWVVLEDVLYVNTPYGLERIEGMTPND